MGLFDGVDVFALNESFTACSTEYNHATADGQAILQLSSSPLRSLSAHPDPNHLTKDGFGVLGTLGNSVWCDRAGSRSLCQTPLYGTNVTLFSSDVNHGSCSVVPSEVDLGHASHAETVESVKADTPSIVSSSDRTALGSNTFDDDGAAELEEDDDVRGRWRPQWPVPEPTAGNNWRPESLVLCGFSPYAAMPPDSGIQVGGGSDVPKSFRTNSSISRRQDDGDDFPVLPQAQRPRVFTTTESPKTTRYAISFTKPGMTWAERFKATIASPSEKELPEPPTELRDLGSVIGSSDNLTRGPGKQLDPMEVSDETQLQRVPMSFPRTSGPVNQRRALLPIEWQVVAQNTSPATTPKSDNPSIDAQSSVRSSEHSTCAYGMISKSQGHASRTDISIKKRPQTITASCGKAPSAPGDRTPTHKPSTPINATERLVEADQNGMHLPSAASQSTLMPSWFSATSPSFTPRTLITARLDLPKKPSYAEVASFRLPVLPCTPTTPSSGSGAFFSAPQSPEPSIDGAHGVLLGAMAKLNLEFAAAAQHSSASVLKKEGEITEKEAAGLSCRIVPDQSFRENHDPLSRCNSDQRGKKRKKKKSCKRKIKGISPATPRSAGSLPGQLCSLTPSDHNSIASTWARSEPNSAPQTQRYLGTSKVEAHGVRDGVGTESPLRLGMSQSASQIYTEVAKVAQCSKITIVIAAEHVGWYCPACYFKQQ